MSRIPPNSTVFFPARSPQQRAGTPVPSRVELSPTPDLASRGFHPQPRGCKSKGEASAFCLLTKQNERPAWVAGLFLLIALLSGSCSDAKRDEARKRITPEYDKATGKLKLLRYDADGNGVVDTLSYMDGA